MHGCGHDGHTAMLLGAAQYLSTHRDFDGTVVFIFQPAEEGGNAGARAMMQDGLFDRFPCDAVFGIHNMPGMPVNQFGFRAGPTMASSNRWDIVIRAWAATRRSRMPRGPDHRRGRHGACLADRDLAQQEPAGTGGAVDHADPRRRRLRVIPGEAVLRTVRTYSVETLDKIEADMRRIATTLPQVYGGTGELDFVRAYPPLVNWEQETAFAAQVAENAFGAEHVLRDMPPFMGAEDFVLPGESAGRLSVPGNGDGDHRMESYHGMGPCQLHNPNYDFNDALLPVGATYWVKLVQAYLPVEK